MTIEKKPKWGIGATITAGQNACTLALRYRTQLEPRIQSEEIEQLKSNVSELSTYRSGQKETLVFQKSKTENQDQNMYNLRARSVSIRKIVKKSGNATTDILKAFGVGEKISSTLSSAVSAGNIVIAAYNTYKEWSNSAGIIESDITEITSLVTRLSTAGESQNNAMFNRKTKTMSKNVLQRTVEDKVSKISAIGQHVFFDVDKALAKLFEELIPSSPKGKGENPEKEK